MLNTGKPIGPVVDPDAEKRSLMLQRKVLCNGQATGVRCASYWTVIRNEPSQDPDMLVIGGKLRFCRAWGAEPLEFGEGTTELATLGKDEPLVRGCERYWPAGVKNTSETVNLAGNSVELEVTADEMLVHIQRLSDAGQKLPARYAYDPAFEEYDDHSEAIAQRFVEVPLRDGLKDTVPQAPASADEQILSIEDVLGKFETEEELPLGFLHKLRRFFRL